MCIYIYVGEMRVAGDYGLWCIGGRGMCIRVYCHMCVLFLLSVLHS